MKKKKIVIILLIIIFIIQTTIPIKISAVSELTEDELTQEETESEVEESDTETTKPKAKKPFFDKKIKYKWEYHDAEGVMAYGLYTPSNANEIEEMPMILYLHGSGQTAVYESSLKSSGLPGVINNWNLENFSAYILCPHLREWDGSWPNHVNGVTKLLKKIIAEYNIDEDHIVLAGESRGATGALNYTKLPIKKYISKCVAFSPFVGSGNTSIDTLCFYASNDQIGVRNQIGSLKRVYGADRVHVATSGGHGSVGAAALKRDDGRFNVGIKGNGRSDLIEWMFEDIVLTESAGGNTNEIISQTTGLDTYTGIILEPTVEFFTFVIDSIMSVFSSIMTQRDFQFVMVSEEELKELEPALRNVTVGASYTIPDMTPYKTVTGSLELLRYPYFTYSSEEIFAGELDLLDVNFIKSSNQDENWLNIRNLVSQWYQILRILAIIGLLSVLIYIGIKIIISSTSKDKAKYKEMILSWFIAVILAFSMHYIMAFILSVIEEITGLLQGLTGVIQVNANGVTFNTNLIGLARFQLQQQHFTAKVGYLIIYTALVVYTFKFTFLYLKRLLKMAFLTIISPIVALTYPIDKANDGKAQGFNMWLKEFLFNALLQPMHYILYYIVISSSLSLSVRNPIYAIAALMFMSQAEKILKKIFGFDKARAGTVGGIAGAFATGAVTSSFINHVKNPLHPFGGGSDKSGGASSRNIDYNYNFDDEGIDFNEDTTNMDNLINMNLSGIRKIPGVEDYIYRYRQNLPQSIGELGGLYFDDGNHNSMEILFEMINNKQLKLEDENISPEDRIKLEKQLRGLESVLQNRVIQNEMPFGGNMQYTDEYNKTDTMKLIDEIRKLNKQAKNLNLSPEERKQNSIKAEKLLKTVKRRMAENQYMQKNDVIQPLMQQNEQEINISQQNEKESAWSEYKKKHPTARGMANVGRTIAKPVWDMEKDVKYNGERLAKNIVKGVVGTTVGVAAATVQAGMSITDGKYNPVEGVATVSAGVAGVSAVSEKIEKGRQINSEDKKSLEKYSQQWFNSDNVINSYNFEFGGKGKEMRERAVKNYVSRGITDVEEQKKAIKFAELIKKERGLDEDEADKVAVATLQYRQGLIRKNSYMVLYDTDKRKKHIDLNVDAYTGSASKDSVRRVHEELIENVRDFDRANE